MARKPKRRLEAQVPPDYKTESTNLNGSRDDEKKKKKGKKAHKEKTLKTIGKNINNL